MNQKSGAGNFWALLPLIIFIIVYFSGSLYLGDFYALPVLVVFVIALFVAFFQYPKKSFDEKLKSFAKGSGDENILIMILIFLLAGAFSELSKSIGSLSSTVNFAMTYISPQYIVAGIFLIACFISVSLGTSVGTIVALGPLAVGFETYIPGIAAIALAAVVGGAMFGDNLSFISDTTIAATRTQNVSMRDKFKANFKVVFPVAVLVFIIYCFQGASFVENVGNIEVKDYELIKVLPYVLVFVLALVGVQVIWTLGIGIIGTLLIGLYTNSINVLDSIKSINSGFAGMFELSLLCLIIGGVVGIIRYNGGIDFLLNSVLKNINSKRGAEVGIASLTALVNFALANNTITIVIVGPLAKEISNKFNLSPTRVASILDTTSCFIQGVIPYGAQILAALAASSLVLGEAVAPTVSPIELISYLYYPFLTGIATLCFILFRKNK
ncbi:putative methionine transporter (NhaC family) [Sphingobacterium alimentarium]|uniref:Putative methionine transporter (NhaC family) n=1 Tax=Sphingobacterium alimentarium TaxID=797292 RepID=A0A4R3VYJ8_9SPHI|nr:Na+/H+ antiporter NhaC family protein [Sphingobacterium alimentarium]TCV18813.1 putative methionine transporter (NhaC family) [Sphingobacterium alimentarium]